MTNEVKPYLFLNYPLHIFEPEEEMRVEYDEINESLIIVRRGKIEIIPIYDPISTNNSIRYRTPESTKGKEGSKEPHPLPLQCKLNTLNKRLIGILMTPHTLLILRDKKTICMLRYPIKKKVKKVIDFFWITKEHVVVVTSRTVEVYALGKKFRELKTFSFRHNISFCRFHPHCKIFVVVFEAVKAAHVIQPFRIGAKALMKLSKLALPERRYQAFKKNEIELAWLYNITFLVILQSKRQEADLYRLKKDNFELMRKFNLFSPGQFHISVVDSILIFHNTFNMYSLAFDVFAEQSIPVAPPMSIAQYKSFHRKIKVDDGFDEDGGMTMVRMKEDNKRVPNKEDVEGLKEGKSSEIKEEEEKEELEGENEKKDKEEEEEEETIPPTVPPSNIPNTKNGIPVSQLVEPKEEILLYDSSWRYYAPNLILCPKSGTFHELQLSLLHIPLTIKNREERIKFLFRRVNSKFLLKGALRDLLMIVHHSFHELTTIFKIVNKFYYQSIVSGRIKNISLIQPAGPVEGRGGARASPTGKRIGTGLGGGTREFGLKESEDQLGDPSMYQGRGIRAHLPAETEGTRIVSQLGLPVIEQEDMLNLVFIPLLEETKKIEEEKEVEEEEEGEEEQVEGDISNEIRKKKRMKKFEDDNLLNLDKMCLIVLEYMRSLINHRIPIQPKVQNFFVDILIDLKRYESLRQYIRYKLIRESKAVAMKLISISDEFPQAFDLALQMLVKEKEYGRISQIFLERGEILKVMHLIERYELWEHVVFQKIEEEKSKEKKKGKGGKEEKEVYEIVDSIPMPAYVLQVAKDNDDKMVLFYHAYQKVKKIFRDRKVVFPFDDQTCDYESLFHIVFGKDDEGDSEED